MDEVFHVFYDVILHMLLQIAPDHLEHNLKHRILGTIHLRKWQEMLHKRAGFLQKHDYDLLVLLHGKIIRQCLEERHRRHLVIVHHLVPQVVPDVEAGERVFESLEAIGHHVLHRVAIEAHFGVEVVAQVENNRLDRNGFVEILFGEIDHREINFISHDHIAQ